MTLGMGNIPYGKIEKYLANSTLSLYAQEIMYQTIYCGMICSAH